MFIVESYVIQYLRHEDKKSFNMLQKYSILFYFFVETVDVK
jgi:hypothetical protein